MFPAFLVFRFTIRVVELRERQQFLRLRKKKKLISQKNTKIYKCVNRVSKV